MQTYVILLDSYTQKYATQHNTADGWEKPSGYYLQNKDGHKADIILRYDKEMDEVKFSVHMPYQDPFYSYEEYNLPGLLDLLKQNEVVIKNPFKF